MTEPNPSLVAEVIVDAHAEVGEGPTWDADSQRLCWVDIPHGDIHAFHPASGSDDVVDVGQPVGAVVRRRQGGLVLAVRDGFATLDEGRLSLLAEVEIERVENRMNDGKVDPAGRFWAGTMALDSSPGAGALYRLAQDHRVDTVLDGLTISNGMDWSPDGQTMYFIDSGQGCVTAYLYDQDSGEINEPRTLIAIPPEDGLPDGMTVDSAGGLWVAIWDGAAVRHYSPDGTFLDEVRVPATQVTSCAFGGADLRDLYITTAAEGLSPAQRREQPHAGALFRVQPGVVGREPYLCSS